MLFSSLTKITLALAPLGVVTAQTSCTLTASGGDDAPALLQAVRSCATTQIPNDVTLNIATRMNMTGLIDKHIQLEGTLRFNPDIPYWTGNGFFIPFQTQITFWLLGGENIVLTGGGMLDGAGQVGKYASNSSLLRPIVLTVFQASNVLVKDINYVNAPSWHNMVR
ncbi:hypothetical protein Ac2012v2_005163 [Leucoagaricus gongylophorus]